MNDEKPTTGYCFIVVNCLISWCSRKQSSVSLPSTEPEYIATRMAATSMAASKACWLINLLSESYFKNICPVVIDCNNQSAIMIAKTDTVKRLNNVEIRYHFIKEQIRKVETHLKYFEQRNR